MRYLYKDKNSSIINSGLIYSTNSKKNSELKKLILREQKGFCAYSEKYICKIDSCDIEHFDPRKKYTENDNYYNWYIVISWINQTKAKKIGKFLPILEPNSEHIMNRIIIKDNLFIPKDNNDIEAKNLIDFLGFNSSGLY